MVHLSDIHFSKSSGGVYDLDQPLRKELENDAQEVRKMIGDADGVLVTGDIAFGGNEKEYIMGGILDFPLKILTINHM